MILLWALTESEPVELDIAHQQKILGGLRNNLKKHSPQEEPAEPFLTALASIESRLNATQNKADSHTISNLRDQLEMTLHQLSPVTQNQ